MEALVERLLALDRLDRLYGELPPAETADDFLRQVFDVFRIGHYFEIEELERVPRCGGAVVVADHPVGAIEGGIVAHLLRRRRPDVKIMANYLPQRIELRDLFIPVDPFGGTDASSRNLRPLRDALRRVLGGGLLVMFPRR